MIYGIGIDIVKIGRIRRASEKWGRKFLERFLSQEEISYCSEKNDPYPSLAVRFAAKEALIKAVGAKIIINMKDIEVVNDETGRPFIRPGRRLEAYFRGEKIRRCHLSLSHEKEFGVACVVLEK